MRKQVRAISLLLAVLLVFSLVPNASAAYSDVPAEMLDNCVLRALAYTGYKVQKLKDEQHLYQAGYYGAALKQKGNYFSGITYGSSMDWRKTRTDSSSPTGVVPDIANMKTMDCISFITYFYLNYLPNVEGWDASGILNHPEKAVEGIGNAYNDMWFWYLMFDSSHAAWNKSHGISTVATLSYTEGVNNTAAYQNALKQAKIGDLLRMGNSGSSLVHYAIYAGHYNGEHWIIHVANSRGPEIGIVSGMADSSSSKQSWVLGIYRFEGVYEESGSMEVYKTDSNGKNLAGAVFAATETTTGKVYPIGPTDSNGYAKTTTKIPYGTYKVVETKFPEGYTGSGQTEWTVTLNGATPNGTVTIRAVNALRAGEIRVQKVDTGGNPLDGVAFLLEWSQDGIAWQPVTYTDSPASQIGGCTAGELSDGTLVTGKDGLAVFSGLCPTLHYRLTETAAKEGYQLLSDYAFVGALPSDNPMITIRVVNAPVFTLPLTGSQSMVLMPIALTLCLIVCVGALVVSRRKERDCR